MTKTSDKKNENLQISILGQYLKDLSFENPNAPEIFQSKEAPKVEMDVNVAISKSSTAQDIYEVCLKVRASLKQGEKTSFIIEVAYAGLVEIKSNNEDAIKAVLATEVPKLLFPYVRQIISNVSISGGFPPLNLAPINFGVSTIDNSKIKH